MTGAPSRQWREHEARAWCWPTGPDRPSRLVYDRLVAIRVALAEDSYIVREGIEQLLSGAEEVEVVASCENLHSLIEAIEREAPDVVLTDIRMPPTESDEGIQIATRLRKERPNVGVVVLSQYSEPHYVLRLLDSGSERRAYLLKERIHDRRELVAAIERVAAGGAVIDPKVVEVLVDARARVERSPLAELTPRELEVLHAIAEGKSNSAIAEELVLTKRAVEKHINAIFLKLGFTFAADADSVSKRVKAALLFLAEAELHEAQAE
jgi:DNA-binding NarL/FixJ family response regulator